MLEKSLANILWNDIGLIIVTCIVYAVTCIVYALEYVDLTCDVYLN